VLKTVVLATIAIRPKNSADDDGQDRVGLWGWWDAYVTLA